MPPVTESFAFTIPKMDGTTVTVRLGLGEALFVIGANGSGKSALLQRIYETQDLLKCRRILAHRQTWFQSGGINLTPAAKRQLEDNIRSWDRDSQTRWRDSAGEQRSHLTRLW